MAKGGRESKDQTLPAFFETALQQGVGMGTDLAQAPYAAYRGPDVAAFSPLQCGFPSHGSNVICIRYAHYRRC